jgi:hypothetical protein
MLAHILLNYDVRTEVEGVRPENQNVGSENLPNQTAKVMFRKRHT